MTKIPSKFNESCWIDAALKQKKYSKDLEKIISVQERIIKAKEREFEQIEKLFLHYLDKYETYSWWYSKYRLYYDAIVKVIKSTGDARLVYELKKQITQGDMSYWGSDD